MAAWIDALQFLGMVKGGFCKAVDESRIAASRTTDSRAAMRVKRGRGERISGHEPFGWDFGPDGLLVENRGKQKALAWIRELHEEGKSLREIAELLNGRGIKPKRSKRWAHSSVLRIGGREWAPGARVGRCSAGSSTLATTRLSVGRNASQGVGVATWG